jgi:hypothetical protein
MQRYKYMPCYEKGKILVFVMDSVEDAEVEDDEW